jgi:predicted RNA binding protein YcfA (HicA-like mRNA interferase family)
MKVQDAIKLITKDGWYELKQKGTSHRQFKHPLKKGRVTIAGKLSGELSPKTLASIQKQAGLE